MGKIHRLSDRLVNLIAAGEVVERPASVAKELAENSLDAGATRVDVRLEGGGATSLEVSDDGEGMGPDDALLALERHATSKLGSEEDLDRIATLGFRGEALPSIAEVSRMEVLTRRRGEEGGTRLRLEGGRLLVREVAGSAEGCHVTVRDLFFNTPARQAYLRPAASEASHVVEALGRLALAAPEVQFLVTSEGRPVLRTDGDGDLRGVLASLWGVDVADRMLPVAADEGPFRLRGLVSRPDLTRANRNGQAVIIRGRPVSAPRLRYAAEAAYRGFILKGRFPYLVLKLDLPAEALDPNVHPTKAEVRLRDEAALARMVHDAVAAALGLGEARPQASREAAAFAEPLPHERWDVGGPQAPFDTSTLTSAAAALALPPRPRARLQVKGLFIVAEGEDALFLIDQHAAHERVGFERLGGREEPLASQGLLAPLVVNLGEVDRARLGTWRPALAAAGFQIEPFGRTGEVVVRAVPAFLFREATPALVADLLRQLGDDGAAALAGARRLRLAMAACRAAVKRHDALTLPEMEALIAELWATSEPRHCPHGRPTWVALPYHALEHGLGRL